MKFYRLVLLPVIDALGTLILFYSILQLLKADPQMLPAAEAGFIVGYLLVAISTHLQILPDRQHFIRRMLNSSFMVMDLVWVIGVLISIFIIQGALTKWFFLAAYPMVFFMHEVNQPIGFEKRALFFLFASGLVGSLAFNPLEPTTLTLPMILSGFFMYLGITLRNEAGNLINLYLVVFLVLFLGILVFKTPAAQEFSIRYTLNPIYHTLIFVVLNFLRKPR